AARVRPAEPSFWAIRAARGAGPARLSESCGPLPLAHRVSLGPGSCVSRSGERCRVAVRESVGALEGTHLKMRVQWSSSLFASRCFDVPPLVYASRSSWGFPPMASPPARGLVLADYRCGAPRHSGPFGGQASASHGFPGGSIPSVKAAWPAEERLGIRSRRTSRREAAPANGEKQ